MQHNSETEQKIITAAREVFLEKGKDGARMHEIADRAHINKALLHYYFRSKDKLFSIIFQAEFKSILSSVLESLKETTDIKKFLQQFLKTYLSLIIPRRSLLRFILWEFEKNQESIVQSVLETFKQHGFETIPLVNYIQKAIDAGQIRKIDVHNFVLSLLGMCIFPVLASPLLEQIIPEINTQNPQYLNKRIDAIIDLVLNGIKPN